MVVGRALLVLLALALAHACACAALAGCAERPVVISPLPAAPPVCPLEGCTGAIAKAIESAAAPSACPAAGEAPCRGSPAPECTDRALAAWSEATDDRALACVARTMTDACELGDPRACGFAGRLWLDGRGVERDVERGIGMLARACDDGVPLPCRVAVRWLADGDNVREVADGTEVRARLDAEHECLMGDGEVCFKDGVAYSHGSTAFPVDPVRSTASYARGCALGQRDACNILGDALEYGSGIARDITRAVATYERGCRLGMALACANFGYLLENGLGVARDTARARTLYRDACGGGEVYACLHHEMMAVQPPGDPFRAVEHWERACAARDARACAFAGLMWEDGPDGYARDETKSRQAMERGCELGNQHACEWLQSHPP
jgi:uncharacterized protein